MKDTEFEQDTLKSSVKTELTETQLSDLIKQNGFEVYVDGQWEQGYLRKDLVSFGNFLLSKARYESITAMVKTDPKFTAELIQEHASQVYHADVENWITQNESITA